MSQYITFPQREMIMGRLAPLNDGVCDREPLFRLIAQRLGGRTVDSAAFAFVLIETLHEYEEFVGEDLSTFLPRCVLALTEDEDLAESARQAFSELRGS